ncbi:hypothetical protein FB451DRAFT_642177 [Mycena latifolia]|nr:hypothetical protein FB451DRAFT_642177 [Mycena latifolia]
MAPDGFHRRPPIRSPLAPRTRTEVHLCSRLTSLSILSVSTVMSLSDPAARSHLQCSGTPRRAPPRTSLVRPLYPDMRPDSACVSLSRSSPSSRSRYQHSSAGCVRGTSSHRPDFRCLRSQRHLASSVLGPSRSRPRLAPQLSATGNSSDSLLHSWGPDSAEDPVSASLMSSLSTFQQDQG